MTSLRMLQHLTTLLLLSALALRGDATTDTVTVSITPNDTLSDLYFLYAQGDVSRFGPLTGTAPAGVTSTFPVTTEIGLPIPGAPFFSVIGVYTAAAGPMGVYVALDATDASSLVAAGTSFDNAFTSFSGFFSPGAESTLIAAMQDPDGIVADGFTGADIIDSFADIPEQQTPQLFTPLNLTGTTDANFVKFSDATPGGSVEVSLQPVAAVPEPASGWMLGVPVLAWAGYRRLTKKAVWRAIRPPAEGRRSTGGQ
jgi:hypothetical protein